MNYQYSDGTSNFGELSEAQIRERMALSPTGKHLIWQAGWAEWKDARSVISIPVAPAATGVYHYSDGTKKYGAMKADDILACVARNPAANHLVWQEGWSSWRPAAEVFPSAGTVVPPAAPAAAPQTVPAAAGTATAAGAAAGSKAHEGSKQPAGGQAAGGGAAASVTPAAAGGARKNQLGMWLGIGIGVLLVIVLLGVFLGGSEDDFTGYFVYTSDDNEAFLRISKLSDDTYRIQGEALIGTRDEYGPNSGTLDIEAKRVGDELRGNDHPDYSITITQTDQGEPLITPFYPC